MFENPEVFRFIGGSIENATNTFVTPTANNLMLALQLVVLTGVTLYITLTGYAIATGAVESPFWTFVKQCIKIIIIAFFALTADGYTESVMGALKGLEEGLVQSVSLAGADKGAASTYQMLDESLGKGLRLAGTCFERASGAGWNIGAAISWFSAGMTVGVAVILVMALGGAMIIVAKFSLAIVFSIGPLFIVSLMFPVTARFFDSWFSQVMNYTITIVVMAIIMAFAVASFDTFIDLADVANPEGHSPMRASLEIAAITGVLIWIILQAGGIASGLAGGVSMAAMGIRHLISPVTATMSAAKGVANAVNPVSTRRDMESGMMTTARRANHLVAGNTMWNPAYRQHVMQNMGKNWGKATGGQVKK
jgi:type IV secretion system protein VirB6